jgi:hypothetical protein
MASALFGAPVAYEEGLDLIAKGLALAEQTGLRVAEAELYRVKGELLMMKDPDNLLEAERCLRIAIDVAMLPAGRAPSFWNSARRSAWPACCATPIAATRGAPSS